VISALDGGKAKNTRFMLTCSHEFQAVVSVIAWRSSIDERPDFTLELSKVFCEVH
jgi:hypothetical protein